MLSISEYVTFAADILHKSILLALQYLVRIQTRSRVLFKFLYTFYLYSYQLFIAAISQTWLPGVTQHAEVKL